MLTMSMLAVPGFALLVLGARRRNPILAVVGAVTLARAARRAPRGLLNP
jgi:hypothetical protein